MDKYMDFLKYFNEYYQKNKEHLRYGQALFNSLYMYDAPLANVIRGSNYDPYYSDFNVSACYNAIAEYFATQQTLSESTNSQETQETQ